MSTSMETGVEGRYNFELPTGHDYTLTPQKNTNLSNGVSTFDLVLIKKHILGMELLDSPYKMIAADANHSENITTFDLVVLRKIILLIDTTLSNNTSWRFVESAFEFPDPTDPWATPFPEIININDLSGSMMTQDFVAIKVGDVNGNAIPNNLIEVDDRQPQASLFFEIEDRELEKDKIYVIDFEVENLAFIEGYQYALQFDPNALELLEIKEGVMKSDNFGLFADKGLITTSWEGNVLDTKKTSCFQLAI